MSKHILCGIALALLLLSGCVSNPDVQLVELSKNTVVYDEIVHINNCGGKGDSEQIASREFVATVELGAGGGANYQVVQANLFAKYSEYRSISKSQRLVAPPGTNMEFVLRWSNDVRAGNVQVNGKIGTYEVRIPVSVEQVSSRDLGCGISVANATKLAPVNSQVEVYANKGWQDTQVLVSKGQFLRITYLRGQWSQCEGFGGEACAYVDANGLDFESPHDNVMTAGCKDAKLIARISSSSPFCVGGQFYGKMEQTGHLELRMNDALIGDNGGSVIVSIEVETR